MNNLRPPRRLEADLSTQIAGTETLVYDERRHIAFCLDPIASAVWRHCDGNRSVARIAASAGVSEDQVVFALSQLQRDGLLQPAGVSFAQAGILSRRRLLGTAAVLLPIVAVMTAPAAAQYSGCADCGSAPQSPQPVPQPAATPNSTNSTSTTLFKP